MEWTRTESHFKPPFVFIRWNGHTEIDDHLNHQYRGGRGSVSEEKLGTGHVSLELRDVQFSDNGTYKCLVKLSSGLDSIRECLTHIHVVESVVTTNANVKVKEGEGAVLTCHFSDDFGSDARVEWKFVDKEGSQTTVYHDRAPTTLHMSKVRVFSSNYRINKVTRNDHGRYYCVVSGNKFGEVQVMLTVLVPPSPPLCTVPQTVTTGRAALLTCRDSDGSPPPTYKWYKDGMLLPEDPTLSPAFQNLTYKMNSTRGSLEFPAVSEADTGSYSCEALNEAGPPQRSEVHKLEVRDSNTGAIVGGVLGAILAAILLFLLACGLYYANKKRYLTKKNESKSDVPVVYKSASRDRGGDDKDGDSREDSSVV